MKDITVGFSKFKYIYLRWYSENLNRDIIYRVGNSKIEYLGRIRAQKLIRTKEFGLKVSEEIFNRSVNYAMDYAEISLSKRERLGGLLMRFLRVIRIKIRNPFRKDIPATQAGQLMYPLLSEVINERVYDFLKYATIKDIYGLMQKRSAHFHQKAERKAARHLLK